MKECLIQLIKYIDNKYSNLNDIVLAVYIRQVDLKING